MAQLLFHAPAWLLLDDGEALRVTDAAQGESFDIRGELRQSLLAGDGAAAPMLQALGAANPLLQRLALEYTPGRIQPLTRDLLLTGGGLGQLFVELTARCNERCSHCYAESSPEREETLEWDMLTALLADAKRLGFTHTQFTGGDPLTSPYCLAAVKHAREIGLEGLEVYTNGLALSGKLYDGLRELAPAFAFSFYSASAEEHDGITRTPGSQARTLAAIRRVVADGLEARASVVIMDANRGSVDATVEVLVGLGIERHKIAVDQARETGRGQFVEQDRQVSNADAPGPAAHSTERSFEFAGKAAVAPDGTVYPCIFSRGLPLGHVRDGGLYGVLTRNTPVALPAETWRATTEAMATQMTCFDCRVRNVLLGSSLSRTSPGSKTPGADDLVPLKRAGGG